MQRFLHTSTGRAIVRCLIVWLVLQPFWEVGQRSGWPAVPLGSLFGWARALVLPGTAYAAAPIANAGPDRSVTKTQPLSSLVTLDGTQSHDPDGDLLTYQWYGPFPPASGPTPTVQLPEGQSILSLIVDDGTTRSAVATTTVTMAPCFALTARAKPGNIQLIWAPQSGTGRYDIYRATAAAPVHFAKIAETPSTLATFLDTTVVNGTTYLYLVGAMAPGSSCYSAVTSAVPPSSRVLTNAAPVLYSSPSTQGTADILYTYDVNATDPQGDALRYRLVTAPAGMDIDLATGLIRWLPSQEGNFAITVEVSDGRGGVGQQHFSLTVSLLNTPPVAHAGPDQTVLVGDVVTLDGSRSTDLDGDPLTYHWSLPQVPTGSAATLDDPNAVRPRFTVDTPGTYLGQLVVNDGQVDSTPDTVAMTTGNTPPVAHAGPDQTAAVMQLVQLDGSASSDVDGNTLTFRWAFVSQPAGSHATLSDPMEVQPTFAVDVPGVYVVQLIVNDDQLDSAPDTVLVTTVNSPPVAHAGRKQTVVVGTTVTLDGSESSDVDGDLLTFRWAVLTQPPGSHAILSDPAAVKPTLVVDAPGPYVVQLIVHDGQVDSAPDTVLITTVNSPPVAHAGPDQTVLVGQKVQLDGSQSSDVDGDVLTYHWAVTAMPSGSQAMLSDAAAVRPTFVVDAAGTYVVQLIVHDGHTDSGPDTVVIITANAPPVAHAGPDQSVFIGQTVQLDGSQSTDVDGDLLSYRWSFTVLPAGSTAVLSGALSVNPTFLVDRPGLYVVQLMVNDGQVDSAPDTAVMSTENSPPVAHAGADQQVIAEETVTLDGNGSFDADGDLLTYRWAFLTLPVGSTAILSDATVPAPVFVADLVGTYVLQLIVHDGQEDSRPDTMTVIAAQPNRPPRITSKPITTATVGQLYNYDVDATDPDTGDILTFSLSMAPGGMTINASTGLIQWTPAATQVRDTRCHGARARHRRAGGHTELYYYRAPAASSPADYLDSGHHSDCRTTL